LDGLSLGAWVISRIQNPDAPFARRRIDRNDLLRSEPSQALFAQFLQPVIIGNRFGQFLACPIDADVKTAPPIAPQGTERHFNGRGRRGPIANTSIKLIKTPLAGPRLCATWSRKSFILAFEARFVFFCHAPSVTLDARLVGEAWPPRFMTKLVLDAAYQNWRAFPDKYWQFEEGYPGSGGTYFVLTPVRFNKKDRDSYFLPVTR